MNLKISASSPRTLIILILELLSTFLERILRMSLKFGLIRKHGAFEVNLYVSKGSSRKVLIRKVLS